MTGRLLTCMQWLVGWNREYTQLGFCGRFIRIIYFGIRRFVADEHSRRAIALTYYTLFAVVPLAALVFGIAKGFDLQENLKTVLSERFADHKEVLSLIIHFADTTLKQAKGGVIAGVGVIALIWTVMWLAYNIEAAFNKVWNLPNRRNLLRKFSDYLALTILVPILLVVLGSAGVFIRNSVAGVVRIFPWIRGDMLAALSLAVEVLPVLIVVAIFGAIYYLVPNTKVRLGAAILAGVVAGILYQLLQNGFIVLQMSISRYNSIYGSFAALPLFLIWLQWSWQLTLFGAELSFVAHNIDSGMFVSKTDIELSHQLRRQCQYSIVRLAMKNYEAGIGATSTAEIGEKLSLWKVQLEDYLGELFQSGILIRTVSGSGEELCVPGLPARQMTIPRVADALDSLGGKELDERTRRELEIIQRCCRELRQTEDRSIANRPLGDL